MCAAVYPHLTIDGNGNVAKGAPLPIPRVIPGALVSPTLGGNIPYVNPVGNESQIPSPLSGLPLLRRGGADIYNPEIERDPVNQGSHFGHVMNDEEGELDSQQLNGINQIPAQAVFNFMYQPYTAEGSLFTTQLPPPPGAPLSAAARERGPGSHERPRIPGVGGVGPTAGQYSHAQYGQSRREKGRTVSIYDEESSAAAKDSRAHTSSFKTSASLAKARLLAGSGVGNTLEMVNPQSQKVTLGARGGVQKKSSKKTKKIYKRGH